MEGFHIQVKIEILRAKGGAQDDTIGDFGPKTTILR